MGFFKSLSFAVIVFIASSALAGVADSNLAPPILPKQFAGWQLQGSGQASKDAAAADPTKAALLKEYGFTDVDGSQPDVWEHIQ